MPLKIVRTDKLLWHLGVKSFLRYYSFVENAIYAHGAPLFCKKELSARP